MSSLVFCTDKNQVFVATDTLATSPDGSPLMFTSKAFVIPHLQLIICCTGIQGILGKWFIEINDRIVVRGIDHLNYHTPDILPDIYRNYKNEHGIPENITSTIYHFGFSEEEGIIHNYVYRSINNFVSENLPYGVGIKPECTINYEVQLPIDLREIMEKQRIIQQTRPKSEKVFIGGKIQAYLMTKSDINIYIWDHFNDYELTEKTIYDNFKGKG